jgi:hypothetical protein
MISDFIKFSRAHLKDHLAGQFYYYFYGILENIKKTMDFADPEIHIVYSINKTCETFRFENSDYIIYDQYLGQVFNKFNRIIFHESNQEAKAYLCKLLSEEFYLTNQLTHSTSHFICYTANTKANATDLPESFLNEKQKLCTVQESFVFLHELSHILISKSSPYLIKAKEFYNKNAQIKIISKPLQDGSFEIGDADIDHLMEEFACDIFAIENIFSYHLAKYDMSVKLVVESILLAFLYLRTLLDLKLIANGKFMTTSNKFHLFTKLRYNLIRAYCENVYRDVLLEEGYDPIDLYERWEKKIDMNIVLFLNKELKAKLLRNLQKSKVKVNIKLVQELLKIREI